MTARIHYGSDWTDVGGKPEPVCRAPGATRVTDVRKGVTCKRCRVWLRLMYPRARNLPLAKRKLHFYGPGLDEVTARCGMYNHMGLVTGKMANVTCGRCRRLLGLRRAKKMNANRELFDTGLVVHRRYTPGMFG